MKEEMVMCTFNRVEVERLIWFHGRRQRAQRPVENRGKKRLLPNKVVVLGQDLVTNQASNLLLVHLSSICLVYWREVR